MMREKYPSAGRCSIITFPSSLIIKKQRRIPYVSLLIINDEGKVMIEQRPADGLLANMWQFPMVPIAEIGLEHIKSYIHGEYGIHIHLKQHRGKIKHVFSHII